MWFLYFLPILIAIPFILANRNRGGGKASPRLLVLGLALVLAMGAVGFAAVELTR